MWLLLWQAESLPSGHQGSPICLDFVYAIFLLLHQTQWSMWDAATKFLLTSELFPRTEWTLKWTLGTVGKKEDRLEPKEASSVVHSIHSAPSHFCASPDASIGFHWSQSYQFSSVQLLSRVRLFATPWVTACQSYTCFKTLLKCHCYVSSVLLVRLILLLSPTSPRIHHTSSSYVNAFILAHM